MDILKKGFLWFKKEEPKEKEKQLLRKLTIERIGSIKQSGFSRKGFDEISRVFRLFLMKNFGISYEFTHHELEKELDKKEIANELRSKILEISDLITEVSYKNKKLTKQLFHQLIKEVENIIELTTITVSIKQNIESLKKGLIEKKIEGITKEVKEKGSGLQEERISKPSLLEIEHLFKMITEAQNALLNFNLEEAKYIYLGILRIYRNLPLAQQEKIYPSIKELYDTRKRLSYVLMSIG